MSQLLKTIYASAPVDDLPIHTIELNSRALTDGPIRLTQGYDDLTLGLETGETGIFLSSGFGVSLPEKGVSGRQDLHFKIDNVTAEALKEIKKVNESGEKLNVIYRVYASSDLSSPATSPIHMVGVSARVTVQSVSVFASFNDLVNSEWPSRRYTPKKYPGLKYV